MITMVSFIVSHIVGYLL